MCGFLSQYMTHTPGDCALGVCISSPLPPALLTDTLISRVILDFGYWYLTPAP